MSELNKERQLYKSLISKLYAYGLREETRVSVEKMFRAIGLEPPQVDRTKDVMDRVTYSIEINRYILSVHTKFNRKEARFSRHSGRVEIIIARAENYDSKRLFCRKFNIRPYGTFVQKVAEYVAFFCAELRGERRPMRDSVWAELKEIKHDEFWWVDKDGKKIRNLFAYATLSRYRYVFQDQNRRLWYRDVARPKLGIKHFQRDLKKPYKKHKKK
jgi:hypothetical protein